MVALIAIAALIVTIAEFGFDNLSDVVRIAFLGLIFVLAVSWLRGRETARWVGWVVVVVTGVAIVFNLADLGSANVARVIVIVLLGLTLFVAAAAALGRSK